MKKFPITKFYFNLFVALFVIFLFLTFLYTKIINEGGPSFSDYFIMRFLLSTQYGCSEHCFSPSPAEKFPLIAAGA